MTAYVFFQFFKTIIFQKFWVMSLWGRFEGECFHFSMVNQLYYSWPFNCQFHKMVKHTKRICRVIEILWNWRLNNYVKFALCALLATYATSSEFIYILTPNIYIYIYIYIYIRYEYIYIYIYINTYTYILIPIYRIWLC